MPSFSELLGVERAIVQAPIGGCAGPALIAEVSAAGGLGILPCTWSEPEAVLAEVRAIRARTGLPFGGNLVLAFDIEAQLDALLAARAPLITFSWGRPGRRRVERCHEAGARVGLQVGSAEAVASALEDGIDLLIAQGTEAGGHVQSTTPLEALLIAVLDRSAGAVPVIAAGGLATAADVRGARELGAHAAMLGTRFVATVESEAHQSYKEALVSAVAADSRTTLCFDGEWPFAAHRVLRNATLDAWEATGCPRPGARPGEGAVVLERVGRNVERYSSDPPRVGDRGSILEASLYAGTSVQGIDDIPPAGDLVRRLDAAAQP